jgi:hypothetical protein
MLSTNISPHLSYTPLAQPYAGGYIKLKEKNVDMFCIEISAAPKSIMTRRTWISSAGA